MMDFRLSTTPLLVMQPPVLSGPAVAVQQGLSAGLILGYLFPVSVCMHACMGSHSYVNEVTMPKSSP